MRIWRQEDFANATALGFGDSTCELSANQRPCSLVLLRPDRLEARDQAAWDDLAHNCETANVFAQPWLMRHSLANFDAGGRAILAVVADADGAWIGAILLDRQSWHGRVPMPHWRSWSHANQFCSTPLVRRGRGPDFWRGLLAGLDVAPQGCLVISLSGLAIDEPANRALVAVCEAEGREFALDARVCRPALDAHPAGLKQYEAACGSRQRRRLASLARKLESERGEIAFSIAQDADAVAAAIDPFLALEASGWKGAAGSALASATATRRFFEDVARKGSTRGCFELAILTAGGKPVAMSSYFVGERWSYGFKMGFDAALAPYAPGVILLDRLTRALCERGLGHFDSCSAPGNHPVNRMWSGRRELMDCRIAIGTGFRRLTCRVVAAGVQLYHALKPSSADQAR